MATMILSDIEEFETEGERTFYKFLEGVAKPDAHYLCWYTPDINGNEPDFILYCEDVGLVIFEGKDSGSALDIGQTQFNLEDIWFYP